MDERSDIQLKFHLDYDSAVPLYLQFKEQMLLHIRSGRLAPGSRLPDIKSLAVMAGTSLKTINSGLNELLRERVCVRRPKRGTFVAEANQVVSTKRKQIVLLYHKNSLSMLTYDDVRQMLLRGIQQGCRKLDIDLVYLTGDLLGNLELYCSQEQLEVIGVIILEGLNYSVLALNIADVYPNLRFIYFNDYCEEFINSSRNVYGVFHDDFSGGYAVGSCLASCHPAKLGAISIAMKIETYSRRLAGFRLALQENGYHLETDLIEREMPDQIHHGFQELKNFGEKAAREILDAEPEIGAIFTVNDLEAEGVWNVLKERGLLDKVILFGYDNLMPEISRDRHFSTVDIDFTRMGERGIELVASSNYIPKAVFQPPQLICRLKNNFIYGNNHEQN